jgi:DNA ligase 1
MKYAELVTLYEELDSTSKRLEKTNFISIFLKKVPDELLDEFLLLVQGKIFPDYMDKKIGISSRLAIKAISKTTGNSENEIEGEWKKLGDLGDVSKNLLSKIKQASLFPKELDLQEVFNNLRKLSTQSGMGSVDTKLSIVSEMLINAKSNESKYLIRTIVDNMRVGVGKGSIRDAIIWSIFSEELKLSYNSENNDINLDEDSRQKYKLYVDKVQMALDLTNDFSKVAKLLRTEGIKGLETLKLVVGRPINVMLYQKAKDVADAFDIVGRPAAFEYKYDGFRVNIHKNNDEIKIFTRRLENVTEQFPDIVEFVKNHITAKEVIMEGEAVGYDPDTKKYVPFQKISQRIRRKYDIVEISKKFPVEVNLFDIIYHEGNNLISTEYKERRRLLESSIISEKFKMVLAKQIITDNDTIAQKFYDESLKSGEEGVMVKKLDSKYKPGARVGYGVKLKSIMEPLDLVIVGAEYGEGKRSGALSSFILACMDQGDFLEIGRVSTGLKELDGEGTTFKELTNLLKPNIIKTDGKNVVIRPSIVIEVGYEEIQKSINYGSGYALRFPRFIRLRNDEKTADDVNSIDDVEYLYQKQRGRG